MESYRQSDTDHYDGVAGIRHLLTPSLPQPVKFPGLKDARIRLQNNVFSVL